MANFKKSYMKTNKSSRLCAISIKFDIYVAIIAVYYILNEGYWNEITLDQTCSLDIIFIKTNHQISQSNTTL